jgi:AcrR family transcriptional regulator
MAVAVDIVAQDGWERLNADALAARAGAGKAGIYRRWPSMAALMVDALSQLVLVDPDEDTGTLRGDLTAVLQPWTRPLSAAEEAAASLVGPCHHDPDLHEALHRAVVAPLAARLHHLAVRHRVPADQEVLLVLVVQALWWERYRTAQLPLTEAAVQQLADDVLLPLVRPTLLPTNLP